MKISVKIMFLDLICIRIIYFNTTVFVWQPKLPVIDRFYSFIFYSFIFYSVCTALYDDVTRVYQIMTNGNSCV